VCIPEIWKAKGDCRCLFRSIYRAVFDPHNKIQRDFCGEPQAEAARNSEREGADKIRRILCATMRKRRKEVAGLLAGTVRVDDYIKEMEDWHTWGDAICLRFLPDIVKRPIQVYALNVKESCLFDSGMHLPSDKLLHKAQVIVLWYNGESHYDLVSTRWLVAQEEALYCKEMDGRKSGCH